MSTERFTHQRETNKANQWMNLEEVANALSVSPATIRNWIKTKKIVPEFKDKVPLFNQDNIKKIEDEIESGASHRLKSRRNKRAVKGNVIPVEYVDSPEYIQITEEILEIVRRADKPIEPRGVLLEVALGLLLDKQVISFNPEQTLQDSEEINKLSLTELVLQNKLNLGSLEQILLELWDFRKLQVLEAYNHALPELPFTLRQVLQAIRRLEIRWIPGEDVLGLIYMALSNLGTRKSNGSYYTPTHLVEALVQKSLKKIVGSQIPKVVDPCCGSGNFLIKSYLILVEKAQSTGRTREEAEKEVLVNNLQGYDIDSIAVSLARINLLLLLEGSWGKSLISIPSDIANLLNLKVQCKNTLDNYGQLLEQPDEELYDLVIGNPPWGYHFTKAEVDVYRKHFQTAEKSVESFSLFIEQGLSLLKEGGLLAYVLPEALLSVKTHRKTRELLLKKTKLIDIQLLGHQFSKVSTPTITLLASRVKDGEQRNGLLINRTDKELHQIQIEIGKDIHWVSQKRFDENEMYTFNVRSLKEEEEVLEQMRCLPGALFLAGEADFALGIVTGNNKELVLQEWAEGAEPVLKGNDIFKYNAYPSGNYLVFEPEKFQQVAPVALYRASEKLLYRFINENLVFAYDDSQTLSLNSANTVIPRLKGYSIKYVLAILNSRAAQFFHTATFSSVKVLRRHLESLPIPPCDLATQEEIVAIVDQLMKTEEPSERIRLYEQIDEQCMRLFRLTTKQQELIQVKVTHPKYL